MRTFIYGGSFTPACLHHREIVRKLLEKDGDSANRHESRVIVVPCGPRPDKETTSDVDPVFRAAMCDMTFDRLGTAGRVTVDLFDLENAEFTRTAELDAMYRRGPEPELWHVVCASMVAGGAVGQSLIHRKFREGKRLWTELRFVVVQRKSEELNDADLPPCSSVLRIDTDITSKDVRTLIFHREEEQWRKHVKPEVARFISRYGIYRGKAARNCHLSLGEPARPLIRVDDRNPRASGVARDVLKRLGVEVDEAAEDEDANLILVFGGDGFCLHTIRNEWRRRVPLYGVNCGHLGFLLNEIPPAIPFRIRGSTSSGSERVVEKANECHSEPECEYENPSVVHCPLLKVDVTTVDGRVHSGLAFNDTWVERSGGQTAWIRILVNGKERTSRLVCDGALIATAAGSTCYARAMGAAPVPLDAGALTLVGSNVLSPAFFRPVVLPIDVEVELQCVDSDKRPLRGFIDGVPVEGAVLSLKVRVSRTASVELAFSEGKDMAEKLALIQFPS